MRSSPMTHFTYSLSSRLNFCLRVTSYDLFALQLHTRLYKIIQNSNRNGKNRWKNSIHRGCWEVIHFVMMNVAMRPSSEVHLTFLSFFLCPLCRSLIHKPRQIRSLKLHLSCARWIIWKVDAVLLRFAPESFSCFFLSMNQKNRNSRFDIFFISQPSASHHHHHHHHQIIRNITYVKALEYL